MSTSKHDYHHDEFTKYFEISRKPDFSVGTYIGRGVKTYEKLAFEEPRLKPTVPYALTISKMTLKMLNHGSSALPIIRVRYLISLTIRFPWV